MAQGVVDEGAEHLPQSLAIGADFDGLVGQLDRQVHACQLGCGSETPSHGTQHRGGVDLGDVERHLPGFGQAHRTQVIDHPRQ